MITMAPRVCQVLSEGCLSFLITVYNKHMWHVPQEAMDHGWVMMSLHLSYVCILEWQEPLPVLSECLQETRWKNKWKRTAGLPVHVPFQLNFFGRLQGPLFAPIHWVFLVSFWRLHDSFYEKLHLETSVSGSWHYQAQSPYLGRSVLLSYWVSTRRSQFEFWSGHMPGYGIDTQQGCVQEATDQWFCLIIGVLPLSLLLSLKSIKTYIFKKSLTL